MKRTRAPGGLVPNPFVAFADLTIALAFIFALCTFAFSKALSDVTRDERQETAQDRVRDLLQAKFPGVRSAPAAWTQKEMDPEIRAYNEKRNRVFLVGDQRVGSISTNASYQRLELAQTFAYGQPDPIDSASIVELGKIVQEEYARGDIAYVFLHAVLEEGEAGKDIDQQRDLARQRVDHVYDLWHGNGIIGDRTGQNDGRIDPQYVVIYGKEGLYRNDPDLKQKGWVPGRVDVVLFFTDKADKAKRSLDQRA